VKLLTSQKDELFDIILSKGLSPLQFQFYVARSKISDSKDINILRYKESDFNFSFEENRGSNYSIFCPGSEKFEEHQFPGSWAQQIQDFKKWLSYLLREINTPNKWERLQKEIAEIGINYNNDQDKFNVNEYEELKHRMLLFKERTAQIGLSEDQMTVLNGKLDHLIEQAKEMNKFDWKSLFVGTIMSLVIQLTVPANTAKTLWSLVSQVFNNYYFLP
jgi:hypothetical protein